MQTFPDMSVARLLLEGYGEQPEPAVLRTEMESGPPKQARVLSRVMVTRPVVCYFATVANYQTFMAWFRDGINYGADWFHWPDPVDGTSKLARIVGGKVASTAISRRQWRVTFSLETWSA